MAIAKAKAKARSKAKAKERAMAKALERASHMAKDQARAGMMTRVDILDGVNTPSFHKNAQPIQPSCLNLSTVVNHPAEHHQCCCRGVQE